MTHLRYLLQCVLALILACSSSDLRQELHPERFDYSLRSELQGTETRITLSDDSLTVYHKAAPGSDVVAEQYVVDTSESHGLFRYLRSINFHEFPEQRKERMLDAPEETLTVSYDGRSSTMSIGGVPHLQEEIVRLRKELLDIATKHSSALKSALGY